MCVCLLFWPSPCYVCDKNKWANKNKLHEWLETRKKNIRKQPHLVRTTLRPIHLWSASVFMNWLQKMTATSTEKIDTQIYDKRTLARKMYFFLVCWISGRHVRCIRRFFFSRAKTCHFSIWALQRTGSSTNTCAHTDGCSKSRMATSNLASHLWLGESAAPRRKIWMQLRR